MFWALELVSSAIDGQVMAEKCLKNNYVSTAVAFEESSEWALIHDFAMIQTWI